jgi:hypothetical protein
MSSSPEARTARRRRALFTVALALLLAAPATAQDDSTRQDANGFVPREVQLRALKKLEHDLLWQEARSKFAHAREWRREQRQARKHGARGRGLRARRAPETEAGELPTDLAPRAASRAWVEQTAAVPTNVRVNNTSGDAATAGQAEEAIASMGNYVLVAWNNGQGFVSGGDVQTAGYSVDGGATFTQVSIPHPAGITNFVWTSDPMVTVDEKRSRFYYCGMAGNNQAMSTTSYVAIAAAHFSGSSFSWDSAFVVRSGAVTSYFFDKPWCTADSLSGNVYVTNTTFDATDHIDFYRSTNGGRTWSSAYQLSMTTENGYVQGSRPAVGPTGEIYAVWSSIGLTSDADYFYIRRAPNPGGNAPNWGAPVRVDSLYSQFGTGAPGFNRERGITFPSIVVDRTRGTNRGRVYVAWNETWDVAATNFPLISVATNQSEIEPNNSAGTATLFTPSNVLRGTVSYNTSTPDYDYFKCALTAGQHFVAWGDSFTSNATYTLRLFAPAPDSAQRLCFGASLDSTVGVAQSFFEFTAPVTGTYYLRIAPAYSGASRPFKYRIRTQLGTGPGGYRARDQRDVFVKYSDNGTSWYGPTRPNDNGIGFDDWLPEVGIGSDGCPYVFWFDFRDDTYGSRAHQYASRSQDGGATWQTNARLTSAQSNFTTSASNIAPNQGDYSHLFGDSRYVHPTWADGRGTNVDVWSTTLDTWFTLTPPAAINVNPRDVVNVGWTVNNLNPLFANNYNWTVTSQRNWPMPSPGTFSGVAPGSSIQTTSITIPDSVALGSNVITLTATNDKGTRTQSCAATLNVITTLLGVTPATYALALAPARPNPAFGLTRLDYTLPARGHVRLTIYGLQGDRVRRLVDGDADGGPGSVAWDGRDDAGRSVASGAYFVRFEAFGRTFTQRIVWMR